MHDALDIRTLLALEPISCLSPARLRQLLDYCQMETACAGSKLFQSDALSGQSVYLVKGSMEVAYVDGNHVAMHAGSEWARHPVGKRQPAICSVEALTDVQLLCVDDELLDQVVTWDQFAHLDDATHPADQAGETEQIVQRLLGSGMFSAENLSNSPFARLPSANIGILLKRIEAVVVWDKEVIVREGDAGDYYYLIESGRARVSRSGVDGSQVLAELKAGDVFGEEALLTDAKRNATVTMTSNGVLLRLKQADFIELMQEPLLHKISYQEALDKVSEGAQWLDVRLAPEFHYDKLPGAINIPLHDVRKAVAVLSKNTHYVVYCQSGRRSSAVAFIMAQAGYTVAVLENGLWPVAKSQQQ
jgi:CRP-like cAMP-binding protein